MCLVEKTEWTHGIIILYNKLSISGLGGVDKWVRKYF